MIVIVVAVSAVVVVMVVVGMVVVVNVAVALVAANVAAAPVAATMAMVVVSAVVGLVVAMGAAVVGPPKLALTMEGPVVDSEVTAAVGAVSLSRPVYPLPRLLQSRLVTTLSRRAAIPSLYSQHHQVVGQALSQPST